MGTGTKSPGCSAGPLPPEDDQDAQRWFSWGQGYAEGERLAEADEQRLFTVACLHGLRTRLCDDGDSLDDHLPPHIAKLARKVAEVLEETAAGALTGKVHRVGDWNGWMSGEPVR
ncbi:hypothetical protein [Streptomyces tibetensis]|uniref:hypothetical protein n=1 Tax=Streptomyces tibetensis TaxID=2382123 RepID=UPI0033EF5FA2